ncbi:MAG: TRAP transporter small permease [Paracoccus sp. (in: a-proteobacteria)]|jgi:C4-dicarboxylate transporter DctM subunit|uniref:TRAP transporter small permease n=1 Tax=unclassified Paracoccus (in: a-proteobacteria) TaxID=2688777 RepID=UPI000C5CBD46|nr:MULTISPECIES: TRAP transporter small permease [unclassified Paracoccus (in: a-proteobacteria)]MAN56110.1 TRAP transporter permease DctQ [Paracoccus sp. (in: a-proteobacteria)]MBA50492.1 TRAP transporter permease DctQ [Paracoccus sp. (in: a-proteobacteria)]MCS5601547.1 TRAP transporter small permease [Paracoccus sp. (in: a-proteobacteria)]HIC65777.1 TRAP transporter small permease [Paracoccus sp. (in: a-proteobacteria)]|tara:strand:- start:662 stop:1219 length:558 start_codon:yes stop_codon:yes gene_type:complete
MPALWSFLDKFESHVCRILLAVFVTLLFAQIVARQLFGFSITWIEELSVILFVWFAYFGASYAARMAAHNRVGFHLNALGREKARIVEAIGDLFWIAFNLVFIWQSIEFISRLKPFVKAQTLGWEMRYVYLALPIAFTLMTLRILQVNYLKLVRGIDPADPDKVSVEAALELAEDEKRAYDKGHR